RLTGNPAPPRGWQTRRAGGDRAPAGRPPPAASDGPHLRGARLQGGPRATRPGGHAERPLHARAHDRAARRDHPGGSGAQWRAARPPSRSMSPEALRALLREAHTIAVVGLSPKALRPSHVVARYLRDAGYRIVP